MSLTLPCNESTDSVTDSGVSALLARTPFGLNFLASSLLTRIVRRFYIIKVYVQLKMLRESQP